MDMTKYILILYRIILFPILKQGGGYEHDSWGRPSCLTFQGLNYVLCLFIRESFLCKSLNIETFYFWHNLAGKEIFLQIQSSLH